jgi:hypothetical protein
MQSKNCFHASKLTNDGLRWSGRPGPRRVIFSAPHKMPDHTKSKSRDYRAKARECEERAEQTRDSFIKEQLIKITQTWRQMADHLEKYSQ